MVIGSQGRRVSQTNLSLCRSSPSAVAGGAALSAIFLTWLFADGALRSRRCRPILRYGRQQAEPASLILIPLDAFIPLPLIQAGPTVLTVLAKQVVLIDTGVSKSK